MRKTKIKEYIFWGMFILFISHKLFTDSMRFDEAVEWYVSKNRFGNMYNLIRSTFQPPLYNVVMHFWLMINDSSEWFRIFNMICETLGAVALYKTVKSITQKKIWGYIAVAVSLCFCSLLYYNQIGGEYPLVLCCIAWCIYFFTKCLDDMSTKYLLLWVLFCILSMYSQYGAFIPVLLFTADFDYQTIFYSASCKVRYKFAQNIGLIFVYYYTYYFLTIGIYCGIVYLWR